MADFPMTLTTPLAHEVVADLADDGETVSFSYKGVAVAALRPPDPSAAERTDGNAVWQLTFPDYPSGSVLGPPPPEDPPVEAALFSIGVKLDGDDDDLD